MGKAKTGKERKKQTVGRGSRIACLLLFLVLLPILNGCGQNPEQKGADPAATDIAQARAEALPEEPEISGETYPTVLSNGKAFGLRGSILCRYTITEIRATVTNRVTGEILFNTAVQPFSNSYAIGNPTSEIINDSLEFNNPKCSNSWLKYKVTVRYSKEGNTYEKTVLDRNLKVGMPPEEEPLDTVTE